jgi:NADH-quinone oxidoreductase E subunit
MEKKSVKEIIKKYDEKKSSSLPILSELQQQYGYLSPEVLKEASKKLGVPLSRLYGVATFYSFLSTEPKGKNIIRVCNSLPCFVNGSKNIIKIIKKHLGINPGETTKDKRFTLELTSCIGCCNRAPAMMVNDKIFDNLDEKEIRKIIKSFR